MKTKKKTAKKSDYDKEIYKTFGKAKVEHVMVLLEGAIDLKHHYVKALRRASKLRETNKTKRIRAHYKRHIKQLDNIIEHGALKVCKELKKYLPAEKND